MCTMYQQRLLMIERKQASKLEALTKKSSRQCAQPL